MLETIQDYLKDKTVLLVGNGDHTETEDYNIVIRINRGILDKPADIWVNNLLQQGAQWKELDFKYMLRLNSEKGGSRLLTGFPTMYKDRTYFWSPEGFLDLAKSVGYAQPFTGTTTLHWLTQYTEPKSITVIGMNFFEDGNYTPIHKPTLDREYVLKLAEKYPIILK